MEAEVQEEEMERGRVKEMRVETVKQRVNVYGRKDGPAYIMY